MRTTNNNLSALPFYTDINEQDWRKPCAYGEVFPLIAQQGIGLPFQIIVQHIYMEMPFVNVYTKNGEAVGSITGEMLQAGLTQKSLDASTDVFMFPAIFPMQTDIPEGQYYLVFGYGTQRYYSEVFTLVNNISGYAKLEWYNEDNIEYDGGEIVFNEPRFNYFLYLNTDVGKPEYPFTEEGETRDGYFFAEKQLSEKRYKCNFVAPEYMCDALRIVRMCDHVRVTDKQGRKYECDTIMFTPTWQTQGNLASVEMEFETNTIIKKIGNRTIAQRDADFNNDFNEDYLIETT